MASSDPTQRSARLSRSESRAMTRARLIEASAEVFAERGFYGASVENIADRAGFSRGAFYSNFETKDDVFLALLDDRIDADMHAMAELERDPSPQAFLAFLSSRRARRAKDADTWALLSAELWLHVLRNRELVPRLAARQRAGRTALARVIDRLCQQMGITLPAPPEQLASVMLAIDDGLMLQEALDPAAVPEELRVLTLGLFVQALMVGTRTGPSAGPEAGPTGPPDEV